MSNNYIPYTVYMHISPNGKRYIGITSTTVKERWKNGKGYSDNQHFTRAIEKYGWDNFQHIIIAKGLTEDEAKWLEVELIREWDSANYNKGYNVSLGGNVISEETKVKMHESSKKTKVICLTTMKVFDSTIEASKFYNCPRSGISTCCKGENNRDKRKSCGKLEDGTKLVWAYYEDYLNMTKEEIQDKLENVKLRCMEYTYGKNHPKATKVICITTMKIFDTVKEGAEFYNIKSSSGISDCCNGNRNYCGKLKNGTKLVWMKYVDYLEQLEQQ